MKFDYHLNQDFSKDCFSVGEDELREREEELQTSYIASIKTFSNMDRKPLAPVFLVIAFLAINLNASSVKCSFT